MCMDSLTLEDAVKCNYSNKIVVFWSISPYFFVYTISNNY